jgi:Ca2+/H+ antiporter, TMEM165/GDT1 family
MDWKLFLMTFGTVFVAELGDKTQLATLALAGDSRKPWVVFGASALALVAAAGLGAAAGGLLGKWIPESWIRRGSAVLFLAVGAWILIAEARRP